LRRRFHPKLSLDETVLIPLYALSKKFPPELNLGEKTLIPNFYLEPEQLYAWE
jgi:hypothetical protein